MKETAIVRHPISGVEIKGKILELGDRTEKSTDLYDSSDGSWRPVVMSTVIQRLSGTVIVRPE